MGCFQTIPPRAQFTGSCGILEAAQHHGHLTSYSNVVDFDSKGLSFFHFLHITELL